jgi:exodeoxyribonuclease VII large subunit
LNARLVNPRTRLEQQMQRADELSERLLRATLQTQRIAEARLAAATRTLLLLHPEHRLVPARQRLETLAVRLSQGLARLHERREVRLANTVRTLEAMSPLATLTRGYAIVTTGSADTGLRALTRIGQLVPGETVEARLQDGTATLEVRSVRSGHGLPELPSL